MIDNLDAAVAFLLIHRSFIWLAIGLLAFGESLAIAGTIIPATPILLLLGTLIGRGLIEPAEAVPPALAGAIVGYWASWAIGRRLKSRIYRAKSLAARRRSVARVRLFLSRWGGPSLVIGRFMLGPLQSMLPLVAGAGGMGPRRFHVWNIVSAFVWVPIVLAPGYLTGRGLVSTAMGQEVVMYLTWTLATVSVAAIFVMLVPLFRR
ncbi:MAG TPA: DedA family protein [Sphingomicrobium sp.]